MVVSGFLIRFYGTPNGTEGALWPSVMIRFGPHWRNSKITWDNVVNAVLDFGTKMYNGVTNIKHGWSS